MDAYELKKLVSDNKPFGVVFTKKDGTTRTMIAQTGVESYLRGGYLQYNPLKKNLLCVFDIEEQDYRMINCSTIKVLIVNGVRINLEN